MAGPEALVIDLCSKTSAGDELPQCNMHYSSSFNLYVFFVVVYFESVIANVIDTYYFQDHLYSESNKNSVTQFFCQCSNSEIPEGSITFCQQNKQTTTTTKKISNNPLNYNASDKSHIFGTEDL